jgi:anti-repressor protein
MSDQTKELVTLENGKEITVADLLEASNRMLVKFADKNKELQPKADFADTVMQADSWVNMAQAAKILNFKGIGRNNLNQILRSKVIFQDTSRNWNNPYQGYVDRGYFKIVEQTYKINEENNVSFKTVVSQKGLDFLRRVLIEYGEIFNS